ncbi:MAG: TldD/PmbA family protein [Myxococcales bacterium]|nr:TldD/PmbA family protein [Myxococcales bacterium]MCB9581383.1 TldD/PmbA family protein [Polyangiaceae bacterium]
MTPTELLDLLTAALHRAGEAEAEATGRFARRGFARFYVGDLGQHMQLEEPHATVRVAKGKRVAEVSTSSLDEAGLVEAIQTAARMAPSLPEDDSFPGFAPNEGTVTVLPARYSDSTARATPEERVARLAPVLDSIAKAGLHATGVLDTTTSMDAVANTRGVARSYRATLAHFKVWALESAGAGGAAGHGQSAHRDLDALALQAETERAIADALRGKNPVPIEPGSYDVVLEPEAVAELLEWLAVIGFGAQEVHQGSSPLSGRLGERITGPLLTVTEDPLGELSLAPPFDREGVLRRRVELLDGGIAKGFVSDRTWAERMGTTSTGNAAAPSRFGGSSPAPSALVVAGGGEPSTEALIQGMERGLYVRRLHYVNGMLEPRRAVMTGLTRDGTFLVEGGKVTTPVVTLRFTDSILEAFARCDGMTQERKLLPNWWSESGSVAAPAVRIRGLRFTGSSKRAD